MLYLKNSRMRAKGIRDGEGVLDAIELRESKKDSSEASLDQAVRRIGEILVTAEAQRDLAFRSLRQYIEQLRLPDEDSGPKQFLETGSGGQVAFRRAFDHSQDKMLMDSEPVRFIDKDIHRHDFVKIVHEIMTEPITGENDPKMMLIQELQQAPGCFIKRKVQ